MSLKGFHILFVTVTMLMFAFFVVWGFLLAPDKNALAVGIGASGIIGTLTMPFYGFYFLRKTRRIQP